MRDVQEQDAATFCSHHVLDRVPWLFDEDRSLYIEWKSQLAAGLRVDPYEICVVGSAATGISLSPSKDLRLFTEKSDIDVAVISTYHFDSAWRTLRDLGARAAFVSRRQRDGIDRHRSGLIFDGCIGTDKILGLLDYGPAWRNALASAARLRPTEGRKVKARVYRDFDALRAYQIRGAKSAQDILAEVA